MAGKGVTREQVFEAAEALVLEGRNPTVVGVRERLGGGSPNTITPLLSAWKAQQQPGPGASQPPVPEPVERMLCQVWGAAWKEAQGQLAGEREALERARASLVQERTALHAEIERLDEALRQATETGARTAASLEEARQGLTQAQAEAREAKTLAEERGSRLEALTDDLRAERSARSAAEEALSAAKVEVATLTERAAQVEDLRALLARVQGD